ncbi:MAG: hypothetical protein ACU0A8_18720 [Limimaricola soesokkakensis]|uniref:hypothetical protein n=1 Tax=Limimaricola soesokkakensis TaxID=1343159 RepID=UPI004059A75D
MSRLRIALFAAGRIGGVHGRNFSLRRARIAEMVSGNEFLNNQYGPRTPMVWKGGKHSFAANPTGDGFADLSAVRCGRPILASHANCPSRRADSGHLPRAIFPVHAD